MVLPAVAGVAIIAAVLWEAFESVVLPRRVTRRFRLTAFFYRSTWTPWKTLAQGIGKAGRKEAFLSYYGPLSLLFLFMLWAAGLIAGFALLYDGVPGAVGQGSSLSACFYLSGTTLFTLGLGDVLPHTPFARFLAVAESGLGFGFLALVISYLPVIYQAFSRREVSIVLLDARAGSPPTAGELLRRHTGPYGIAALEGLLKDWERASAEILESHISYPVVGYFRSQHSNESWIAGLTALLDATAILIASTEGSCQRQARLTFAMCRHTAVDLAQLLRRRPEPPCADRLPAAESDRMRGLLAEAGFPLRDRKDAEARLAELRAMYEPYLQALSRYLAMEIPPWILAREVTDNWRTSAWGRISGFAGTGRTETDEHGD